MSATRRKRKDGASAPTVRSPLDFYPSPFWTVETLLAVLERLGLSVDGKTVLECAAGDGAIVKVLHEAGAIVDAIELDADRAAIIRASGKARDVRCGDFLSPGIVPSFPRDASGRDRRWDFVISNPPYSEEQESGDLRDLAHEFAIKSRELAPVVAFLLRLGFAGSIKRHEWLKVNPAHLAIFSNRPRFRGKGNDSAEYAWWIWRDGVSVGTWEVTMHHERTPQVWLPGVTPKRTCSNVGECGSESKPGTSEVHGGPPSNG